MEQRVNELLDMMYNMVRDAFKVPLGANKVVIEQDKFLDLLDEVKAQIPQEVEEAKKLLDARADHIANARKEAENIRKTAEAQARQMVETQEITRAARERANAMLAEAEAKSAELRRVANEYADDALRRTEEAIGEAMKEVHDSRARFQNATAGTRRSTEIVPED